MSPASAIRCRIPNARSGAGFTLVELLVTIAIVAILAALAAPSFVQFLAKQAVTAQANEMADALRVARSEALKRGVAVRVCRIDDPAAETPACATATGDWRNGWLVTDGSTNFLVRQKLSNSNGVDGNTINIIYQPTGIVLGAAVGGATFTFHSVGDAHLCKEVKVATTGRPRIADSSCPTT